MRDKLIELLVEAEKIAYELCIIRPCSDECLVNGFCTDTVPDKADYLISNGVTIQQWIPVSESLPKPFVSVLVQMPDEKPFPTVREGYNAADGLWYAGYYTREPGEVTHWSLLPPLPMEVEK